MKFISRNINYRYTIKHAMPAEPLTGRSAEPGIHVRFVNGIAIINDEDTVQALLKSDKYGIDFISAEDNTSKDTDFATTSGIEPEHDVSEVKYGYFGKSLNPKPVATLDKDKQKALDKMIEDKAMEIALKMAPEMAKKILENLSAEKTEVKEEEEKPIESTINPDNFTQLTPQDIEDVEMIDSPAPLKPLKKAGRPPKNKSNDSNE